MRITVTLLFFVIGTFTAQGSGRVLADTVIINFSDTSSSPVSKTVTANTPVVFRNENTNTVTFTVNYFSDKFNPSLPPAVEARNEKIGTPDDSFELTIPINFTFTLPGFYSILTADKNAGFIFRVIPQDSDFPKYADAKSLIEPLVYLTTSAERKELLGSSFPKKSLDNFWLKISGNNREAARLRIKYFYEHVTEANRLFSSYKEGWKTDRGMIYIIFGKPDNKIDSLESETWIYYENGEDIRFEFEKQSHPVLGEYFILSAGESLRAAWLSKVNTWRKGGIIR